MIAKAFLPSVEMNDARGGVASYGVRTLATRGSRFTSPSADSSAVRNAGSVARSESLAKMTLNDEPLDWGSSSLRSWSARPDSEVSMIQQLARSPPCARMTTESASRTLDSPSVAQRQRYTRWPHAANMFPPRCYRACVVREYGQRGVAQLGRASGLGPESSGVRIPPPRQQQRALRPGPSPPLTGTDGVTVRADKLALAELLERRFPTPRSEESAHVTDFHVTR